MSSETCEGKPQQLYLGDVLVLQPDQHDIFQKCCGCGLVHHIEIRSRHNGLKLAFKDIGENPVLDGYEFQTEIQDSNGTVIINPKPKGANQ